MKPGLAFMLLVGLVIVVLVALVYLGASGHERRGSGTDHFSPSDPGPGDTGS
jgi:hypothetical protein